LKDWGYKVQERRITIEEVFEAGKAGHLKEMWATGTAAVISPVGELSWKEEKVTINRGEIGALSQRLYDYLYGVHTGAVEDAYGWTLEVK
jgi:branched-chain amino acid aminotransferase